MADPNENVMEEEMMNIIAGDDDGSQYLLNYEDMTMHDENLTEQQVEMEEGNTGEVYIQCVVLGFTFTLLLD